MSEQADVGMEGFPPEVSIEGQGAAATPKEERRIRERLRRGRLTESLNKLRAKVEAGHRDRDKYLGRIADIEEELGIASGGGESPGEEV